MSIDYLTDLKRKIEDGDAYYACPGMLGNEWFISSNLDEMRQKAQRAANARRYDTAIYRLCNLSDVGPGNTFLIVRKLLEAGPRGEERIHWTMVDTREAAEVIRDVSEGPTPYFGAIKEFTSKPLS